MKKYDCSHPFTPDPRRGGACAGNRGEGCDHPRECHPPEALTACRAALLTACRKWSVLARDATDSPIHAYVHVDDAAALMEKFGRIVASIAGAGDLGPATDAALWEDVFAAMAESDG